MENFRKLNWSWHVARDTKELLQYFDKTFSENERDIFYCHLNDIEPSLLSDMDSENESDSIPIDPRTKQRIENCVIDHSIVTRNPEVPRIFQNFSTKSTLSKQEHEKCLSALQALLEKKEVPEKELIPQKRISEMQLFNEFLKGYSNSKTEHYILKKLLIEQYMLQLEYKASHILDRPDQFYSLQTAVPFDIKSPVQFEVSFSKDEIISQEGHVPQFDDHFQFSEMLKRCQRLNGICEAEFVNMSFELTEDIDVVVPEKTLHLLSDSSTILDTWEIIFKINPFDNNRGKLISFDEPLPIRSQNNYICSQMFGNIVNDQIQSAIDTNWFSLTEKQFLNNLNDKPLDIEIRALDLESVYNLIEHDDYIKQYTSEVSKTRSRKSNRIFCKWSLINENGQKINVLTQTHAQYMGNENGTPKYTHASFKLEYKTEFGAEAMTKGELIQEWLKQFLLSNGTTKRVRIDACSAKTILQQNLDLADIESDLLRLYCIRPCDIFSSFQSLLKVIDGFPIGDYLLKFNPKYKDRLMVYTKAAERTPNGFSLHEIYEKVRSKVDVLQMSQFVPIDGNVITLMHEFHNVLPSCFPYWIKEQKSAQKNFVTMQKKPNLSNIKCKKVKRTNKTVKSSEKSVTNRTQKPRAARNAEKPLLSNSVDLISPDSGMYSLRSRNTYQTISTRKSRISKNKQGLRTKLSKIIKKTGAIN